MVAVVFEAGAQALVSPETVFQTPTPGVGVDELVGFWPPLVRGLWFLAGFLAVFFVGWFLLTPLLSRAIRRRNRNNPTLVEALDRYVRLAVTVVAMFAGVGVAGYGNVLAGSALVVAALTLALGVAGRTVIGSVVSGFALVVDPEFNVGDFIQWDDTAGTVQSITLRVTRIRTPSGELVTVPNETLTAESVRRPFGEGRYRIAEHVEVDYDDDTGAALDQLEAAARETESIAEAPSPQAYVTEFNADGIVLLVHYWIVDPTRTEIFSVRSAYMQAVKARFDDVDLTISPASQREIQGRIAIDDTA